jgi:MOSC domain-containing protein YiiM
LAVDIETCDGCRFDGAQYDVLDAFGTLRAVPFIWRHVTEGLGDEALLVRPSPDVWSVAEYLAHSIGGTKLLGVTLHRMRSGSAPAVVITEHDLAQSGPPPRLSDLLDTYDEVIARVLDTVRANGSDDDPAWDATVDFAGTVRTAGWILRHTVHEATHHLHDAGRVLHLLGAGAPTQQGTVTRLSSSDGGVPKRAVDRAEVTDRGFVGDRQADRRNHGRPLQALCLWSADVIEALQAEGHPIEPGFAGENITVRGLDWPTLRPGVQVLIGDVLAEVSAYATPCAKNAPWFTDRYFNRMDHDRHPGWSRVYAWVREPGTIRIGDAVIVEP